MDGAPHWDRYSPGQQALRIRGDLEARFWFYPSPRPISGALPRGGEARFRVGPRGLRGRQRRGLDRPDP